ncbi:hypothetical protein ACROYT_G016754 [Oculina patagonica]
MRPCHPKTDFQTMANAPSSPFKEDQPLWRNYTPADARYNTDVEAMKGLSSCTVNSARHPGQRPFCCCFARYQDVVANSPSQALVSERGVNNSPEGIENMLQHGGIRTFLQSMGIANCLRPQEGWDHPFLRLPQAQCCYHEKLLSPSMH